MNLDPTEVYRPRTKNFRGIWAMGQVQFKVYELLADGKITTEEMIETAVRFLRKEVMCDVEKMGDSNGVGFVIIHPGDLGVTIAAHWWAQGSVLCQRIYRHQYGDDDPLDTINRPAIACVWELEIITFEQEAWRNTMMKPQPQRAAYLEKSAP